LKSLSLSPMRNVANVTQSFVSHHLSNSGFCGSGAA
jgi:hypothetical protein